MELLTQPLFWLLAIIGIVLTGISKSGLAGGAGVVAVPLLALIMPVQNAVILMLPVLLVMDAKTIHHYRHYLDLTILKRIIPAAIVGIILGGLSLNYINNATLEILLGVISIVFALWQALTPYFAKIKNAGFFWGTLSGFTSTLIHAGGLPINIYLISQAMPKLNWLATTAVFFGFMNLTKVIPYTLAGLWQAELFWLSLLCAPLALIGVKLGYVLQSKINQAQFMLIARALLFVSGVLLVLKGII